LYIPEAPKLTLPRFDGCPVGITEFTSFTVFVSDSEIFAVALGFGVVSFSVFVGGAEL